jgi:hypothetical protein
MLSAYLDRYRNGCGHGFDGDEALQRSIAQAAGAYLGIEPDESVMLGPYVTESHRCFFEDAPVQDGSIDVAFAVIVLEHLADPARLGVRVVK